MVSYLYLCWLNLTMLSTAAMMKNMSMGSNRMYWEIVIEPVSVTREELSYVLHGLTLK